MEKNINRILIVVIIIFLIILSCMKIIAFEYKYDTNLKGYTTTRYKFSSAQDTIIARDGDGYDKKINLSSNEFNTTSSYIYVAQGQYTEPAYHKGRATSEPCDLGANCKSNGHKGTVVTSIVHQPNVWCVQHGISLDSGDYKVGGKKVVQSPALAYILNQRNINMLPKDWVDAPQIALWLYLYNAKEGKVNNVNLSDVEYIHSIFGNIDCGSKPTTSSKGVTASLLKDAENIYNNAINYENNFANLTTKPVIKKIENSNGNIHIEVSDTTKYEIYIGGVKYSEKSGENTITQFTSTSKDIPISTIMNLVSNGKISLKEGKVEIYIKACDSIKYEASYRVLAHKNNSEQRIIVVIAKKTTNTDNKSESIEMPIDANVSMQKYITSVSDINGNNKTTVDSRDSYLSRENDMNNNDSDSLGVVYKTKYDRDPSKSKSKKTPYKYDNPVKIDYGDKVTYTIEVSNNGAYPVENVVIRDAFPKIGDNIVVDINSIELNKNGNEMNTSSIPNSGMNYLISNSIAAGETKKFTITMKFNSDALKQRTDIIANTARVEAVYSNVNGSVGLKGKNLKRDYRTADRDYVQMKQYEVNLEKYVVGVNGYRLEDFNDDRSVNAQDGLLLSSGYITNNETMTGFTDSVKNKIQRYGDVNKDGIISGNDTLFITNMAVGATSIQNCREGSAIWYDTTSKYKENHPVQVETGDEVTFKIKLTNTGEGNIKVSKITDTFTFTNDATKKISLLESSITGNGGGTISGDIITFNNPEEIETGKSIFVEVKLKVTTDLKEEYELENTAEITEMKNRNNQSILPWDNDGTTNNKDTDYLKVLKQYAVGLNKFITKVNNADLIIETSNPQYNCNSADRSGLSKTDKSTDANKVRVEPGDTVTYTLRLTNTSPTDGGHSAIKVSKIEDIPQKINNNCYLDCDSSYKITENGGGTVTKSGNKLTIKFSKPEEIYPGKYLDITIRFKVVVKDAATATYQTLENTATVTEIKNRNNITVNDVDGSSNNSNSDYIKTKIYKVALEKYVTKVNRKNLSTTAGANYNVEKLTTRKGYPKYNSTEKANDIVNLETGDKVTFGITVKNLGDDYKNYGTVKTLNITDQSSKELKYNNVCQGAKYRSGKITGVTTIEAGKETTIYLEYEVQLNTDQTKQKIDLYNHAEIVDTSIINKNNAPVNDSDGDNNNKDEDYLRTKVYAVSLEKYVSKVVDKSNNDITGQIKVGPKKDDKEKPREGYAEHNYNNEKTTEVNCNKTKRQNPVTTVTGDSITYTILLKNDSEAVTGVDKNKNNNEDEKSYNTAIRIGQVIDYLPNGMQYGNNKYTNDKYEVTYDFKTNNKQTLTSDRTLLAPGGTLTVTMTATVIEDKMSLNILKNVAEIDKNSLTNNNTIKVYDTTENNNKDADYIQLNYKHDTDSETSDDNAFFAGTVWNDISLSKAGVFNKEMDDGEDKLSGITVELYREGYDKRKDINYIPKTHLIVAKTTTGEFGNYSFGDNDIVDEYISDQREKYIKGPKISNEDNRWAGYYSYYIVFTYDGITYTSTNNGKYCEDIYNDELVHYTKDSNASEGNIKKFADTLKYETRTAFNARFETINNGKKIKYNTINKNEYIPESQYIYDPEIMSMKSTTNLIDISTFLTTTHSSDTYLERSKYIGLGLRGRDIFDLELTSDVSKVEVKVNGVTGTYDYTNKIGVRRGDLEENYYEDMANKYISEMKADYVGNLNGEEGQQIRQTDVKESVSKTAQTVDEYDYEKQLLQSILVTYKITVTNASETKTDGRATKVINYFDNKYRTDNITVEGGDIENVTSHSKYNSVLIDTISDEIYITYELDNARTKLRDLGSGQLKTYNMAEIYEYTTTQYGDDDEKTYTKGILDKDSAPGSARIEKARLTNEQISEETTVDYYFGGTDLDKLKYEDDTYATPTLYFTTPGSIRVLRGTVFEDYTVVTDDRVRTGDGIQNSIEPGIEGAKVQLIEKTSSGEIIRYETFTNSSGKFTFTNYLPGNYIMKYFYGDNEKTFYIGDTNTKSYNGEDFKSTNNSTLVEGATVNILPIKDTGMQWYSWNEKGVSTATDNAEKRQKVSDKACGLSDDEMIKLNDVRDGIIKQSNEDTTSEEVRNKLWMYANTPDFTLTVEQSVKGKQNDKFTAYEVEQMNFGIAEVPVTTIDLQKHVSSFSIKDSTGQIEIASAKIADNYTIGIKLNNITDENKRRKVQAVLGSLYTVPPLEDCKKTTEEKNIPKNLNKTEMQSIRKALIQYSIPNIVTIIPNWTTKGNVLPGVKATTTVLDVSIEDAKLQGAKLQVTYDISADIYAEKDFTLDSKALEPSIKYVVDFVDNNLSYAESLTGNDKWQVAQSDALYYGDGDDDISTLKKLDESNKYTTTVSTKSDNDLLKTKVGTTGTTQITLERILTAQDTTIQDIITSSIDAFEYKNEIRILQLGYNNTIDETKIKNKDRIRTPERYIIVPGKHHDSATSETIAIHPPTGDTSTHTMYYIIGAAGLAVLAIGAFGIKKFVLKGKSTKK